MIFYDGKNKADITIIDRNDIDVTADLMEIGTMKYDEDNNCYIVSDVNYCMEYTKTEFNNDNVNVFINGKIL